jgi:hypothetical protein
LTNESVYRWLILIAAALSYINGQIVNLSITPILPHVAPDLGVATNFMTVFLFSGNIVQLALMPSFSLDTLTHLSDYSHLHLLVLPKFNRLRGREDFSVGVNPIIGIFVFTLSDLP